MPFTLELNHLCQQFPGFQPPVEALCIATQGMESGEMITYTGETFSLVVGEPVEFKFFAANHRPDDAFG